MPTEGDKERIDRYRTLNNAVFGLALGLGAFSLTMFTIDGLEDIIMAISLFAFMFTIILGFWHDVHRMLKYPFGMLFAALDYLLIFLVVIMPFTFRLIFEFGEIIEIAAMLFPLNVAVASVLLSVMYQSFVRRNWGSLPKEIILWGKESRNFMVIVGMFFIVSLFIPSEVVFFIVPLETLPLHPKFLLSRFFLWGLAFLVAIIYGVIYEKVHGIKF